MTINRHNYESFFIRYLDNELDADQQKAVMDFLQVHADLREEWEVLHQTKLQADPSVVLPDRNVLYRLSPQLSEQHSGQLETDLILYLDQELSPEEKNRIDTLLKAHPTLQAKLHTLKQVRFEPDTSIIFESKTLLYHSEKKIVALPFKWQRWAAAALLLITAGLATVNLRNNPPDSPLGASLAKGANSKPLVLNPVPAQQPVTPVTGAIPNTHSAPSAARAAARNKVNPRAASSYDSGVSLVVSNSPSDTRQGNTETSAEVSTESIIRAQPPSTAPVTTLETAEPEQEPATTTQPNLIPQPSTGSGELIHWANLTPANDNAFEKKIDRKVRFRTALRQMNRILEKATERPVNPADARHLQVAFLTIALENE